MTSQAPNKPEARLEDIIVEEVSLVDRAANLRRFLVVKRDQAATATLVSDGAGGFTVVEDKAAWSTAFINDLPDSAFLYIETGGQKDADGKTAPRSLRHFPVRDANGAVDLPHLRNALSRIPQANIPQNVQERLMSEAQQMLADANKTETPAADPAVKTTEAPVVVPVEAACTPGEKKPKNKEDGVTSPEVKADGAEAPATVVAPIVAATPEASAVVEEPPLVIDGTTVAKAVGLLSAVCKGAKLAKPGMAKIRAMYAQLSDLLKDLEPETANSVIAQAVEATTHALIPHFAAAHALTPRTTSTPAPAAPAPSPEAKTETPVVAPTISDVVTKQLDELRKMISDTAAATAIIQKENSALQSLIKKQADVLRDASLTVTPSRVTPVESSGATAASSVVWPRDLNQPSHRGVVTKARPRL